MANEQNLVKGDKIHQFTPEEASKGGKRSAEVRRAKSDFKKTAETILSLLANEKEYVDINSVNSVMELADKNITVEQAILLAQASRAMKGNTKAAEFLRDSAGQKPIDRVMIAEIDQDTIDEVEKIVLEDE